jgi:hypothetical protein
MGWMGGWVSRGGGCECEGNTDADDALNWGVATLLLHVCARQRALWNVRLVGAGE